MFLNNHLCLSEAWQSLQHLPLLMSTSTPHRFDELTQSKQSLVHSREAPPCTFRAEERYSPPHFTDVEVGSERRHLFYPEWPGPGLRCYSRALWQQHLSFSLFVDAELWINLHSLLNPQLLLPLLCVGLESIAGKDRGQA